MPKSARLDPEFDAKLTKAIIDDGAKMHAFLSGGGLRVFRLEKGKKLVGYGEHCNALKALSLLVEDYAAGGQPYSKVYGTFGGPDGEYEMYLTGSSTPDGDVDEWLLKGYSIDAILDGQSVRVTRKGYAHWDIPSEIKEWTMAHPAIPKKHVQRGFTMEITYFTDMFANGEGGWQTRILECPPGKSENLATLWQYTQTAVGPTFLEAWKLASVSDQKEFKE